MKREATRVQSVVEKPLRVVRGAFSREMPFKSRPSRWEENQSREEQRAGVCRQVGILQEPKEATAVGMEPRGGAGEGSRA